MKKYLGYTKEGIFMRVAFSLGVIGTIVWAVTMLYLLVNA